MFCSLTHTNFYLDLHMYQLKIVQRPLGIVYSASSMKRKHYRALVFVFSLGALWESPFKGVLIFYLSLQYFHLHPILTDTYWLFLLWAFYNLAINIRRLHSLHSRYSFPVPAYEEKSKNFIYVFLENTPLEVRTMGWQVKISYKKKGNSS